VEVERREHRDPREVPQPQRFGEAADDVIDREVDPLEVARRRGGNASLCDSQDLESVRGAGLYDAPSDAHDRSRAPSPLEIRMKPFVLSLLTCLCVGWQLTSVPQDAASRPAGSKNMSLGNFSVSLAVKDLAASRAFYEKLGFRAIGGNPAQKWLILQNDTSTIGLFQGMFEKNILTFNPGWDRNAATLPKFDDVRDIQNVLKGKGLTLTTSADESGTGPASLTLTDPDGNPILIDQHVARPGK
jgi:catechol 2,3-dioxygenase-like lactoylglutathione lyase family enzyme